MFSRPTQAIAARPRLGRLAGTAGALVGVALAAVLVLAAPASANPGGRPGPAHTFVLPAAPRAFAAQPPALVSSPSISPAARQVRHVAAGKPAACASGNLCTFVWDASTGSWKVFDLFTCARYSLTNWLGAGFYTNSQTGGVTVTFYGSSGNVVNSFTGTGTGSQTWDPVYSIRNC